MVDEKKVFCFWESFKKIKILDIVAKLWKKGKERERHPNIYGRKGKEIRSESCLRAVFTLTLDSKNYIIIIVFLSEKMWRLKVKNDGAAALYYM